MVERRGEDRVGGEVVHLVRPVIPKDLFDTVLIEQIVLDDFDPVEEMADPVDVDGVAVRNRADHPVPLVQEELGKVRPVLTADTQNEYARHLGFPLDV